MSSAAEKFAVMVANEIITSETTYCKILNQLSTEFAPLALREGVLTPYQSQCIGEVTATNNWLLSKLQATDPNDRLNQVAICIREWLDVVRPSVLQVYGAFIYEYSDITAKLRSNDVVKGKKVDGLDMDSCLVCPMSRIPRYTLLCQEVVSRVPPGSEWHTVLTKIRGLGNKLNKRAHQREEDAILSECQLSWSNFKVTLIDGKRRLIKFNTDRSLPAECILSKAKPRTQPCLLWLLTDMLVITKSEKSTLGNKWKVLLSVGFTNVYTRFIVESKGTFDQIHVCTRKGLQLEGLVTLTVPHNTVMTEWLEKAKHKAEMHFDWKPAAIVFLCSDQHRRTGIHSRVTAPTDIIIQIAQNLKLPLGI
ncbi:hypothetical protein Pelo_10284 [Pelomyxa schiedti]|nr:hypothetical protein Pelo_10284 [Pelomyxa schiedti]